MYFDIIVSLTNTYNLSKIISIFQLFLGLLSSIFSHVSFMFPEYSINVPGLSKCLTAIVTALIKGSRGWCHHFCHITGMQFTDQKPFSEEFKCSRLRSNQFFWSYPHIKFKILTMAGSWKNKMCWFSKVHIGWQKMRNGIKEWYLDTTFVSRN